MKKLKKSFGKCYLVGAGPGDPGLLTLRGRECLEIADVVVYDYLSNPELLRFCPETTKTIYVGKKAGAHTLRQGEINQLLVDQCKEGKVVTRLKGGDPFLFGRGGEEAEALATAGIPFEIVPGVSSAIAGPAYAGIPVTHREHNAMLTIFTGHEEPGKASSGIDYSAIARAPGSKVMLMGVERLEKITAELMAHGMEALTPVALVRWATTGSQETLEGTLGTIAAEAKSREFRAPAVAVFGPVAELRRKLNWFESRPLFGKSIAVTRTRKQAGDLLRCLRELGADAFELPTIRIEPPPNPGIFRELVQDAHAYDWLVFTSPNGVDAFFSVFYSIYSDARELGGVRIAVIGPSTAARVKHYRFQVDLQPARFVAEALVEAFKESGSVENQKILLARAEDARDVIPEELESMGAIVDVAVAYRTVPEDSDRSGGLSRFRKRGADWVTFTSSSTAENFCRLGLPWPENTKTASIGPVTSSTMRALGLPVDIEAETHDIPGLVQALLSHHQPSTIKP
jgi:uroporphyrinogen III methyltransferase/synthase